MTNDVRELKEHKQDEESFHKIALYTVFLQPKGKVITDAFIFKPRMYKKGKAEYPSD
jgi:folate-binding Fe-S cluster repair protein YgfZ